MFFDPAVSDMNRKKDGYGRYLIFLLSYIEIKEKKMQLIKL